MVCVGKPVVSGRLLTLSLSLQESVDVLWHPSLRRYLQLDGLGAGQMLPEVSMLFVVSQLRVSCLDIATAMQSYVQLTYCSLSLL